MKVRVNWRNVKLIFHREVRDQLRDRRTLFMIAVLPLLLYPALGIGMVQLTILFAEQPRTVVLLGKDNLPPPQLLDKDRFVSNWFAIPADADKLEVITDSSASNADLSEEQRKRIEKTIAVARSVQAELTRQQQIQQALAAARIAFAERSARQTHPESAPSERVSEQEIRAAQAEIQAQTNLLDQSRAKLGKLFSSSDMQVLVLIPDGLRDNLQKVREQLAERNQQAPDTIKYARPEIVYNKADDKSQITYNRVKEAMDSWESEILKGQLREARLSEDFLHPVMPTSTNLALEEQIAANLWGKLFPALLVIMAVTGAFYPAIDLCAGEKERGTMETLLICPATRTEIVLGKFFTIMSFSCTTALLNLLSMGLTGRHMVSMAPGRGLNAMGEVAFPPPTALMWTIILLIPLAALFSALCLALATFARSSKEGQYYLTPLLMVTLGLTVFCLSPGVELTPLYSVMPIAGVALLLKGLLLSPLHAGSLYWYAIPVLITSILYSALALWWAIDQFVREDVLFREAERLDIGLWVRHLLRDKEPQPSFAEAGFCFVLIMLLQFAAMNAFAVAASVNGADPSAAMRVLLIQQLAIIASPALFMGIMLTTSVRKTFRLYLPDVKILLAAIVLPCVLHPLTVELAANMQWFFPPLPEGVRGVLKSMSDPDQPLWLLLLTFACAPAICEELAFRGFILSGFSRQGRTWLAIGLSSLAFGIMHMIPQQVFNASLLGLVLGMIAIRGDSLLPCIVFHFIYNSLGVLHSRVPKLLGGVPGDNPFFGLPEGQLRYYWATLVLCAIIAIPLLRWLAVRPIHNPEQPPPAPTPLPQTHRDQPERAGVRS